MSGTLVLTDEEEQTINDALPSIRQSSPDAARLIRRLVRASRTPRTENPYAQISEVARAFSVTGQTVRNWVDHGWLPSERSFAGRRKIPRTVLASALALQRPRPATPEFSPERLAAILNAPRRR
jgi:transposase-like protein